MRVPTQGSHCCYTQAKINNEQLLELKKIYCIVSKYHHADEITVLLALFVPYLSLSYLGLFYKGDVVR